MNLNHFRSFLEVVRRGSFSEAARALGVSQPTVSFQVQRLEEELGAKLLERQGGRVVMTAAGREFRAFAEGVLRGREGLRERLAALRNEVAGTLMLGASTHPSEHLLPTILGAFRREHPQVDAIISVGDTAEIVERVLARDCDLGFVGAAVRRRGLVTRKVAEDLLELIAPPDHPFAARASVRLEELVGESFVLREEGSGTQRRVEELMAAEGLSLHRLKPALVVGSNQAVIAAVEAGVGLAFAPRQAAARSLDLGRVRAVPIAGVQWVREIFLVHPRNPVRTRLFDEFVAFVDRWAAGAR